MPKMTRKTTAFNLLFWIQFKKKIPTLTGIITLATAWQLLAYTQTRSIFLRILSFPSLPSPHHSSDSDNIHLMSLTNPS